MLKAMILIFTGFLFAQPPSGYLEDVKLKGKGDVQILGFDLQNKLVNLVSVSLPGEGDFWVRMSDLDQHTELNDTKFSRLQSLIQKGKEEAICQKVVLVKPGMGTFAKDQNFAEDEEVPMPVNPCDKKAK